MKSYKKILLTAAASLIIGTQAFAAENCGLVPKAPTRPST